MNTLIQGIFVDIHSQTSYPAQIFIENGLIKSIRKMDHAEGKYILPGFIDSHVHIESSLLVPENFAKVAVKHGTVATVSDPHEIANVCGLEGVDFMIESGKRCKFKYFWTAPSCVPATSFETSGANLNSDSIEILLKNESIVALGEMMNYPGVIFKDPEVLHKIDAARKCNKPVDGHIPGVGGDELKAYVYAGISTDHECAAFDEAVEKIKLGMKILIREGSSAKNFDVLFSLIEGFPDRVMLCSDDLHADDLINGHINLLVKRALEKGISLFNILKAVSLNPVLHYNLPVGLLRVGDPADFIVVDNLSDFDIQETWINGEMVFSSNEKNDYGDLKGVTPVNNFNSLPVNPSDLSMDFSGKKVRVITVEEGSLITGCEVIELGSNFWVSLKENNILMLFVKDRYNNHPPAKAFVKGFGSLGGAIASTIAHDSHNIIAVGNNTEDIAQAINALVETKGGIAFIGKSDREVLPLPVGGLMSDNDVLFVAEEYGKIISLARKNGCVLKSPLMTLSFLALPVIPSLKLTDKGLFDVSKFAFTDILVQ